MTPRRTSQALGRGGLFYGSQESLCPSYLASYERSARAQRAPSAPRDLQSATRRCDLDLSLVYHHPDQQQHGRGDGGDYSRRSRAVSADREVPSVGWRGTGGRVRHASSSRTNLTEEVFRFLPPEALNQTEPPRLILRKNSAAAVGGAGGENGDDSGIEADDQLERRRKKRSASSNTAEDRQRREEEVSQLLRQLDRIHELLRRVQAAAEQLIQRQTTSEYFQKQMRKETEG